MKGLDLEKVKEIQSSLEGAAEAGLLIAIEEYIASSGNNWVAKNTLQKLGVLIPKVITKDDVDNVSTTDDTIQLNS